MTKEERQNIILDYLFKSGSVQVCDLATTLAVSSVTIRKDLTELEKAGKLYRSHGKAILINPFTNNRSVNEKEKYYAEEKNLIGMEASKLIMPNDSIVLASGTTIHALARCIHPIGKLTVVSASLQATETLAMIDDVEIIQLESRFSGKYYGTDGVTPLNNVKRPYYMWVVGDKNILAYLNRHISLSKIKHGYLNMASFTTPSEVSYDCFNRYMKDGKKINQNKKQMELKSDRSGDFVFVIKADLYPTLVDDKTLTNTENFKVSNNFVKVDHVEKIEDELYSHLITVSISDRAKASGVVIDLTPEQLPSWVKKSNDDTGSNIKTKLSKTSGIQYIIGGVSDAYNEYKSRTKIKFTITKN